MSATDTIGFVQVEGKLEPEALASAIAADMHRRIGEFLVLSAEWLKDEGMPLSEVQRVRIAGTASLIFDGVEHEILDAIVEDVRRVKVTVDA